MQPLYDSRLTRYKWFSALLDIPPGKIVRMRSKDVAEAAQICACACPSQAWTQETQIGWWARRVEVFPCSRCRLTQRAWEKKKRKTKEFYEQNGLSVLIEKCAWWMLNRWNSWLKKKKWMKWNNPPEKDHLWRSRCNLSGLGSIKSSQY